MSMEKNCGELKADIANLKGDLKADTANLKGDIKPLVWLQPVFSTGRPGRPKGKPGQPRPQYMRPGPGLKY